MIIGYNQQKYLGKRSFMSQALITPSIITWARERAQLNLDNCAKLLKIKVDKLLMWENGEKKPTLKQAQDIAQKLQVPMGFLYLKEPPKEELEIPDLRTFSNSNKISPSFRKLLHDIKIKQEWYKDYILENGLSEKFFLENYTLDSKKDEIIVDIIDKLNLRKLIGKSIQPRNFLNSIVKEVEKLDILVMKSGIVGSNTHNKLNLNEFRGFAIYDRYAPLIFINTKDSISAQTFTLLHELVHLWIGESGISSLDFINIDNEVELFCNEIAANILVPSELLEYYWDDTDNFENHYEELSKIFSVSTLVILNRLYSLKYIDYAMYFDYSNIEKEKFNKFSKIKREDRKGDFYKTLKSKLGTNFSHAIIESTLEGKVSYKEASYLLGTKYSKINEYAIKLGVIKSA